MMIAKWAKRLLVALLFAITVMPYAGQADAAAAAIDANSGLPARTPADIAAKWRDWMQPAADFAKPFDTVPSVSAPYAAGELKKSYMQDGLNVLNFYRYISGLPADINLSDDLNRKAAYGAVLLAAEGQFSHEPDKPADMPQDFYDIGLDSTLKANIYGSYGYDNHILAASIEAYMEDSDKFNLDRLGHRRWILNPPLQQVGIGQAKGTNDFDYTVLQVFDESRKQSVDFRYIPYPAQGAFPIEVFQTTTAWSVSINPELYAKPSLKNVKVTLKRNRGNKSWQFDASANKVTDSGKYFNVETLQYGSGPAIIFRPDGVDEYRAGDTFEVRIEGLQGTDGAARTIAYTVNLVSAANPPPGDEARTSPTFNDIEKHWARQTIEWAADLKIVSGFPDGSFGPNKQVTEEQFTLMFTVAMHGVLQQSGHWSDVYYEYAADNGFSLAGLKDATLRAKPITRGAVAELFASAAGRSLTGDAAIRFMLDNGYSAQASVQDYRGADTLTRAEAVQFIKNAMEADYAIAQ